ncbi:EAL domain-containing protein [Salinivibrio kushneri]|uniref:EAL domain-containing protein n=1 Tax=Salinivibrio kushneri TaxID=1908198 RepID=UPI000987239E|nr:EAL domain-containing protein [Salinivibrio kushneri]OOE48468.1 hypothetical protein BZG11_14645 [Salinivibrio kushneri]OOE61630.1 hypothetical protein BZG18_07430 [Salinivibrio kushneri]
MNNDFKVLYQKIISKKGEEVGIECLGRYLDCYENKWKNPFNLDVNARCELDIKIINELIRKVSRFDRTIKFISVNVDLSYDNKIYWRYLRKLNSCLNAHGKELYLEVLENSPMKNSEELIKLNNHGAKICLDDFGVCNSNLHRLMSLPIHLVKVDREVFWMTSHSEQNQSLLKGFIDSLRKNKIKIVCEGLETEGHYTEAEMLGFDYYQGFYFGMPMEINTEELNYEKCS